MRRQLRSLSFVFFFNDTATTEIYTLSLHDALPISLTFNCGAYRFQVLEPDAQIVSHVVRSQSQRSEEHTSELQSRLHLVCRLLLEKKNKTTNMRLTQYTQVIVAHGTAATYSEPSPP